MINLTHISDELLLDHVRKHSSIHFEHLFKQMYNPLYNFAYQYIMDKSLAEDFVQDAFTSLWQVAPGLPDGTNLRKYLYRSIKNRCLDYFRHLNIVDCHREKLTETLAFSQLSEYEENEEITIKVSQLINQLSAQQKTILDLNVFKGLSYKEIASLMELSEHTVHTHIKRAYKFLRQSLLALFFTF